MTAESFVYEEPVLQATIGPLVVSFDNFSTITCSVPNGEGERPVVFRLGKAAALFALLKHCAKLAAQERFTRAKYIAQLETEALSGSTTN